MKEQSWESGRVGKISVASKGSPVADFRAGRVSWVEKRGIDISSSDTEIPGTLIMTALCQHPGLWKNL